jgi:hypothetical protein
VQKRAGGKDEKNKMKLEALSCLAFENYNLPGKSAATIQRRKRVRLVSPVHAKPCGFA